MDPVQIPAEVIAFDAEARTMKVRVVPYGPVITHKGIAQRYTRVDVPEGDPVPFTVEHEVPGRSVLNRIGKIVSHDQTDDGLEATVKFSSTSNAMDVYALAQDGLITDVSGGIIVDTEELDDDRVSVRTGRLDHVAASIAGAFGSSDPGSRILAVHDHDDERNTDVTDEKITPDEVVAFTKDEAIALFDTTNLEDEIRQIRQVLDSQVPTDPQDKERPEAYEVFGAVLKSRVTGDESPIRELLETYALAASPGVSGGSGAAEGMIPADWWTSGLVDVRGGSRPLFDNCGAMPYPKNGTSVGYGKVVSGPTADERAAQDGDIESTALVVSAASAAIKWFDGGGRIPLELIEQSDQAVLALFYGRLIAAVNAKIETYTVTTAVAAGTHHGAVLDISTYAALVADLVTVSEVIRTATDSPGNLIGLPTADWIGVLTMVDGNDRRLFSTQGSAAQDGSGALTAASVDIGGIKAFHVPGLTEALQFNKDALRATDKAPRRLQTVNVLKAGVEVGVLGSAVVAPMIATGIITYEA